MCGIGSTVQTQTCLSARPKQSLFLLLNISCLVRLGEITFFQVDKSKQQPIPKSILYNIKQNPNLVAILSNENVNMINDIYKKVFIVLVGFLFSEIRKIKRINKYTNTFSPIKSYQKCISTHYLVRNGMVLKLVYVPHARTCY